MKAIDTHGLKIKGLRTACGATKNYGEYSGKYVEIFYNRTTGEVWTVFQCSLGQNSWTEYHSRDIINICNACYHKTMQEIADEIHMALSYEA